MEYSISGWEKYWNQFDRLIELLIAGNQTALAGCFIDARLYVNGLTDGWQEFRLAFQNILELNRSSMTEEQLHLAESLLNQLNKSLQGR